MTEDGELIRTYNLPVGGHVIIENGQKVKAGEVIVKIPRAVGKAGDITGGLPRVTELFEARNPSNPAVVSEIDGEVTMGKVKRGNREIIVTSKTGEVKKYLVPLSKTDTGAGKRLRACRYSVVRRSHYACRHPCH